MSTVARVSLLCAAAFLTAGQTGCNLVPSQHLRQSELRTKQLYDQNKALAAQNAEANRNAAALAAEKQRLAEQQAALQNELQITNRRLENLNSERSQLQQRYTSLLQSKSPLSDETTRRFQQLREKYPDFEFDPQTGVSKFHSDLLFSSGNSDIKPEATQLLNDFAKIMNEGDAQRLNILVVGHTDDKPISKPATLAKHPTNWHLSTNRANSVVMALGKAGLKPNRMGVAGYSMYQPVVPNKDDNARQKNRRVEIFVLAPDAVVAGWDPAATGRN